MPDDRLSAASAGSLHAGAYDRDMSMDDSTHDGRIQLTVPAYPQFVRVVRLTAAGALSLGSYSMRFVDDTRAALSEACAMVMGEVGHPGTIIVTVDQREDEIEVEVCGEFASAPRREPASDDLSERLLEPLVDRYEIDLAHDRLWFLKASVDGPDDQPIAKA